MTPRPDSVPTIQTIKSSGLKVGLISDCSEEIARFFPGTPIAPHLDTAILSCEVGIKKPDPKIFGLACERLGVEPGRCIYVGDGNSTELTGASAFGMDAVLIRAPYDNEPHGREDWTPRISSVSQVLGLIAGAP
jgi:putative hydrolase of the HAD superfamily